MRTKRAILTFLSDIIPQILVAIIGLVKSFYFIANLGTSLNGLYSLYSNIMVYLTLIDGGLSSAIMYRLYKPISENNYERISSVLSGSKRIFQVIGCTVFVAGIGLSFFIPFFINDNPYDSFYLQSTFMLYLFSSVISYFTVVNKTIFEAYQRKYVTNTILQTVSIIKGIVETILIMQGFELYAIIGLLAISNLISSTLIYFLSKRSFPQIDFNSKQRSFEILGDVKSLLVHKIGSLIAYNIDIVLVSKMINLTAGAIYTAYTYIVDNVTNILGKLTYSAIAGVGDLISTAKEKSYKIFLEFNALSFYLASIICIPLLYVINPFIQIWHQGRIETTTFIALAFVLNLFYYIIRMPLMTYVNSAGLFKETIKCPIIESVVNLSLSLILINYIGLPGILLGTFIAYIVSDYFIRPVIIYKHIFEMDASSYYKQNTIFIMIMLVVGSIWYFIIPYFPMDGYLSWFLSSLTIFTINAVIILIIYVVIHQALFLERMKAILLKVRKRS